MIYLHPIIMSLTVVINYLGIMCPYFKVLLNVFKLNFALMIKSDPRGASQLFEMMYIMDKFEIHNW